MIDIAYCDNASFYKNIRINRAGHIFAHAGREINRPSGRDDFLFFYVAAGSETFFLNGKRVVASSGNFIIFAPHEAQYHICEERSSEFYYVHFECDTGTFHSLFNGETSRVYHLFSLESLAEHFQGILTELQLEQSFCHQIAVTKLEEIFLHIKRGMIKESSNLSISQINQVHKIIHKINTTWKEQLSLDDYAKELCLSKYHFAHIFKKYTGLSPIAYRNRLRLRYAKGMLEKTDMSIAEIALNVGFAGQQYFCEAFKESFNLSPTDYRKKYFSEEIK